jgi:hypothetical protein
LPEGLKFMMTGCTKGYNKLLLPNSGEPHDERINKFKRGDAADAP